MYRMKQCVVSNQTSSSTNLSKHEPCQVQLEVAFDVKATWKLSLRCKSRKITTHNDFSNNDGLNAIHASLTSSPFLTLTGFWRRSSQRPGRIMFSLFCTWRVWQGTTKALEEMLDQDKVANAFLDVIFDRELNFWDDLKMHISTGCTLRASPASASAALSCQIKETSWNNFITWQVTGQQTGRQTLPSPFYGKGSQVQFDRGFQVDSRKIASSHIEGCRNLFPWIHI